MHSSQRRHVTSGAIDETRRQFAPVSDDTFEVYSGIFRDSIITIYPDSGGEII